MSKIGYILGLDIGVASIGWGAVSVEEKWVECGSRIFPAGLDNFDTGKEVHPNISRRMARSARRSRHRKCKRKQIVFEALQTLGWAPETGDTNSLRAWQALNVYELRSRGLIEQLSLPKLGRIVYHLNQRRGFLSLRKTEEAGDKEAQGMLAEMSELQEAIDASGYQTVGNYLYHLYREHANAVRLRKRHVRRQMLHHEFTMIWEQQRQYYPDILTDALRYGSIGKRPEPYKVTKPKPRMPGVSLLEQFGLENLTFFQRSVFWKKESIGRCELEPEEYRAPAADRRFQEFRILQEVNNLRLSDTSNPLEPVERKLTEEERQAAIAHLNSSKDGKFDNLKKKIAKVPGFPNPPFAHFNLEAGGRGKIAYHQTDDKLSGKKAYGKDWRKLDHSTRNQIVEAMTSAATDDEMAKALQDIGCLDAETIERLLHISLPSGYGHLSVKALENLLPHMRQGMLYMANHAEDSAMHAAGYLRRDQQANTALNELPAMQAATFEDIETAARHAAEKLDNVTSPIVRRALVELRKVVNALIKKHGRPTQIHIEMARSLKMGPQQRKEHNKRNRDLERLRDEARDALTKLGVKPTRDAIDLYRIWQEQNEECIYSGKHIGIHQLLNAEVDIDHIYPYSRSLDDSYMNKVICLQGMNRDKGNRTPYEWLAASNPNAYEQLVQRAERLPFPKRKRIFSKEIPEGFANRDLNETAWMARAARAYLTCLFENPADVVAIKGIHTSILRDQWQLHGLLRTDEVNLKNREDYRHHALDAVVIALCNPATVQKLARTETQFTPNWEAPAKGQRRFHVHMKAPQIEEPWENFRGDVAAALNRIWVSHRPQRKVSGPLHEETYYGMADQGTLVIRKELSSLKPKQIDKIRDVTIREIVARHVAHGGSMEDEIYMPSGTPIRKVRLLVSNESAVTIREGKSGKTVVIPGSTHHVAIYALPNGKHHFEAVSMLEASNRLKAKQPVYLDHSTAITPGAKLLMHLCKGDSILVTDGDEERLYTYNTMASTSGQMWFKDHRDASKGTGPSCRPGSFAKNFPNARKVVVLPHGEIRNA
ncbi:type II CRISPR RNA-guided endonuclease Cas9 [Cerasicoccus frondis]|uniref:type II CRISPR RNA-guided endonuclease Cas9 n=1 Tax=Cerasicoccus frondis TaxID=490090 RepID=UPI0028525A51|nr:type II CRISPR RNA-guided endonuclease Cas9 [Cerasicoccus frondis]